MLSRVLFSLVVSLTAPSVLWAHALGAQCIIRGDKVRLEAYYSDNTPAANAGVRVSTPTGFTLHEGKTGADGRYAFDTPQPGKYLVVIDGGAGHRKQLHISIPQKTAASPSTGTPTAIPESPTIISEGPPRADFVRYPWLKVGLGLGSIGLFSFAFWVARRQH